MTDDSLMEHERRPMDILHLSFRDVSEDPLRFKMEFRDLESGNSLIVPSEKGLVESELNPQEHAVLERFRKTLADLTLDSYMYDEDIFAVNGDKLGYGLAEIGKGKSVDVSGIGRVFVCRYGGYHDDDNPEKLIEIVNARFWPKGAIHSNSFLVVRGITDDSVLKPNCTAISVPFWSMEWNGLDKEPKRSPSTKTAGAER